MVHNNHLPAREATPDTIGKDSAARYLGVENLRHPVPEKDAMIIDAMNEASERLGLVDRPRLFIHEGKNAAFAYLPQYDCIIVPQGITHVLDDEELQAMLAHELGHRKQQPIPGQMGAMHQHFLGKGRFNDPAFAERYANALYTLRSRLEVDADNTAISAYGEETVKKALINMLADFVIQTEIETEDVSSGKVTVDDIKRALEEVVDGTRTTEDKATSLRLQNFKNKGQRTR